MCEIKCIFINQFNDRIENSSSKLDGNQPKEEEKSVGTGENSSILKNMSKSKSRTVSTSSMEGSESISSKSTKLPDGKMLEEKLKKVSLEPKNNSSDAKERTKAKGQGISLAGVIAAKAIAKDTRPSTAPGKRSANLNPNATLSLARRKPIKPKMDLAKALSMMGFGTARTLDPSGSKNARNELNAALTRKMNDFEGKRRKLLELDKQKSFVAESVRNQTKDKLRDDIRTLHEAYQFLARKYMRDEEKLKEKMNNTTTENDIQDMLDDLHLVNNFNDTEDKEEDNDVFGMKKSSAIANSDIFKIKVDRKKTM